MIREGRASDLPAITHVRTSVRENCLSVEQMAALGIVPEKTIAEMQAGDLGCWVAEEHGEIVAFAMADRRDGNIFALFVLSEHESKGFGTMLLIHCEEWLKAQGITQAMLSTGRNTRAYGFYLSRGWQLTGEISGRFAEDDCFIKQL